MKQKLYITMYNYIAVLIATLLAGTTKLGGGYILSSMNGQKGITLLEIIVALGVAAILALLSTIIFTDFIARYRLSATADSLYFQLQYARSEAVKQNTSIYVSFHTGDTWCYGIQVGSACDCTSPTSCSLGTVSYKKAGVISLSTVGLIGNAVYFDGTHGGANASGSITFTEYGQSAPLITTSISRLGNINACSTGIGGYSAC